jgi:hypothetical protein
MVQMVLTVLLQQFLSGQLRLAQPVQTPQLQIVAQVLPLHLISAFLGAQPARPVQLVQLVLLVQTALTAMMDLPPLLLLER